MKKIIFITLLSIICFACTNDSTKNKLGNNTEAKSMLTIDGKALFQQHCASCHNPLKDATGPAMKGLLQKAPNKQWIYDWVHNPAEMLEKNDPYAKEIFAKWNQTQMTAFPNLSNEEIDAIMNYSDNQ